jgi:hypothetical protein
MYSLLLPENRHGLVDRKNHWRVDLVEKTITIHITQNLTRITYKNTIIATTDTAHLSMTRRRERTTKKEKKETMKNQVALHHLGKLTLHRPRFIPLPLPLPPDPVALPLSSCVT